MTGPFGDAPALEAVSADGVRLALFEVLPAVAASPPGVRPGSPAGAARPPALLLVHGATADHTIPASLARKQYRKYERSSAQTDYVEFEGRPH